MLKTGIFLQNRYEIINCIGSGGMADVYKARDHRLNRFVAVKCLKTEFKNDKAFLSKFRVEAQAAAGLAHSNIVNVYDVGEDRGVSFIVMELVEGITLKAYIEKKGKLSVREATSIALQVAAGLEAAHNNGIIHRDVKPQNIIISLDGKAKIADFGIARAASANTINSSVMGSVHYSAPEQTRGGYSDAKSDIYSLGITIFEMLTGRVPFDGDSTVEVALKHLQDEIPSPRKFTPDIPHSTEQIVLKCTQKSPDKRYTNMSEVIRDLKESLVNPDGDFVVIPTVDRKAKTILLSKEEVSAIQNGSRPVYDDSIDTGAAGKKTKNGKNGKADTASGRHMYPGGSYYQNSSYPDLYGDDDDEDEDDSLYGGRTDYPADDTTVSDIYSQEVVEADEVERRREHYKKKREAHNRKKEERGDRILTIVTIIAALIIATGILLIAARVLGLTGKKKPAGQTENVTVSTQNNEVSGEKVPLPTLLGGTEEELRTSLTQLKLGSKFLSEVSSNEYAKGKVCAIFLKGENGEYAPVEEGAEVPVNSTIGFYISTGTDEALTVPELTNKPAAEAEEALRSLGLLVSIDTTRYSESIEKGKVITTNPAAGSNIEQGKTVTIFVSQGQNSSLVEVPDLKDHNVEDAKTALSNLGLYVYVTSQYSDTVSKDLIISQDVEAGSMVETGSTLTIIVSAGPENDVTILDTDGTWMCYAQLNEPEGFNGEPVRIELEQNGEKSIIFEGLTEFPYILNVQGVAGVSTGTVYVYTLDPNSWEITSTTEYEGVQFSRVN